MKMSVAAQLSRELGLTWQQAKALIEEARVSSNRDSSDEKGAALALFHSKSPAEKEQMYRAKRDSDEKVKLEEIKRQAELDERQLSPGVNFGELCCCLNSLCFCCCKR